MASHRKTSTARGASISLDYQAVGRILRRVAEAGLAIPSEFDPTSALSRDWRLELSKAISWAVTLREVQPEWTNDARSRQRYEKLGKIRQAASSIAEALQDEDVLVSALSSHFVATPQWGKPDAYPEFHSLISGIRHLQFAAEKERNSLRKSGLHQKAPLSPAAEIDVLKTPGAAFIRQLGNAYQKSFGTAPDISYSSIREASGPFVAFVEAVSKELGEPMSPEAIRKAWERANSSDKASQKS
jgi:hypothetical protein